MQSITRSRLRDLKAVSAAAAAFAFALVVWGAIVRINNAGMTCPDWPRCRGLWFPDLNSSVVYEWAHRVGAPILTLLILATFALAWRHKRELPEAMRFAWVALSMVVVQIAIGALTIKYANNPPSVAAHLVVGIGTFVSLLLVAYASWSELDPGRVESSVPVQPLLGSLALLTTIAAFIAVIAGGYMSASHAGLACTGFPLCNGWSGATTLAQSLHMAHRFAAYLTMALVVLLTALVARRGEPPDFKTLVFWACGLSLAQGALGVLTVKSGLMPLLRSVHQANGVLLVATLALTTYRSQLGRTQAFSDAPERDAASSKSRTPRAKGVWGQLTSYVQLTKPNVMSLLLFTTFAAMMMAAGGFPRAALVFWTLLGGALASASSASINMYWDRDLDAQMKRTRLRPIPSGRVPARSALVFGIVLGVLAFAVLWIAVNPLAAALSSAGILYYVVVYTMWLKRTTPQNIVIGGAAGSIPPLVGWAAVTHHLDLTAYLLFLIVFVWTPPHFWSLALMKKEEYARVGLPMLPSVYGDAVTKRQIIAYSLVLVALTVLMVPLHLMGLAYLVMAIVLDLLFLAGAFWVAATGTKQSEGTMYRFSMLYLALLFSAMVIDRFGHGGS